MDEHTEPFKTEEIGTTPDGRHLVKDWFRLDLPADLMDDMPDAESFAIYQAREQASTWCVPADWKVESHDGDEWIVSRVSAYAVLPIPARKEVAR